MHAPQASDSKIIERPIQTSDPSRTLSFSHQSESSQTSQTAAEFINSQLQLEADAREALPYKFEKCTNPIGKLRQQIFSCLTCNPIPTDLSDSYTAAGVCYSCSISCHGEHILVELFNKRDFVCDCGTTRLPATSHCALRVNSETNTKGGVHSEKPAPDNKYNQNFRNRFCGCECDYDAHAQKGTMFQCLGIGTAETGGCGEDWWHPGCLVGLGPNWEELSGRKPKNEGFLESIAEVAEAVVDERSRDSKIEGIDNKEAAVPTASPASDLDEEEDPPLPPGFPEEDDFEGFICYKCVESNPWIKRYAGTTGFLPPVFRRSAAPSPETGALAKAEELVASYLPILNKRKAEDDEEMVSSKRHKENPVAGNGESSTDMLIEANSVNPPELAIREDGKGHCNLTALPQAPTSQISLFFKEDFRGHLCRCSSCYPLLQPHEQLLDAEELYEPSISDIAEEADGSTVGSGSIYDRGESALKNVDRVRAIEGVMAYNHLKDKLKPFFQQFAESGEAISAEDIKAHFAKMRGDEQAIKDAGEGATRGIDSRKEQGGY
ncbi:related to metaphase-anaphase transition protein (Mlo2) [Rhynchosporium secalis]|uniref:Related to metaphase-anaphase transition protein (Mlo2) n=1 Tax=Rhynchosporium secalis TaxID=38038 RepID=A0A1E1LX46_RHYSE|nr:related to metaphase-anaphase transition protein (Mlo2) [Rhynchosporium secalis]